MAETAEMADSKMTIISNGVHNGQQHEEDDTDATANGHSVGRRKSRSYRGWISRLSDDVHMRHADVPILFCCSVSGLCDAAAFNATGTFVSMQTGNTVFLALGASHLPAGQPLLWLRAIVAIGCYWAGCFTFSQSRRFQPKRKITLALSFLFQAALIFAAAALAQSGAVPSFAASSLATTLSDAQQAQHDDAANNALSLAPLALLAFQSGGQIVASRALGFNEVPTNVLTSLYCDMWSDPLLLAPWGGNAKRNRRIAAIIFSILGGIISGWLQRSAGGVAAALWLAGFIKFSIFVAWMFWKSKPGKPEGAGEV